MKRLTLTTTAVIAVAAGLAACGKSETTNAVNAPAAPPVTAPAGATPGPAGMAGMPMAAGEKMAKGVGTVTAVGADSITIAHGPIPEANWPAMTMSFKAAPELAKSVKVGDKIRFELKLKDGAGEVTAINKP